MGQTARLTQKDFNDIKEAIDAGLCKVEVMSLCNCSCKTVSRVSEAASYQLYCYKWYGWRAEKVAYMVKHQKSLADAKAIMSEADFAKYKKQKQLELGQWVSKHPEYANVFKRKSHKRTPAKKTVAKKPQVVVEPKVTEKQVPEKQVVREQIPDEQVTIGQNDKNDYVNFKVKIRGGLFSVTSRTRHLRELIESGFAAGKTLKQINEALAGFGLTEVRLDEIVLLPDNSLDRKKIKYSYSYSQKSNSSELVLYYNGIVFKRMEFSGRLSLAERKRIVDDYCISLSGDKVRRILALV